MWPHVFQLDRIDAVCGLQSCLCTSMYLHFFVILSIWARAFSCLRLINLNYLASCKFSSIQCWTFPFLYLKYISLLSPTKFQWCFFVIYFVIFFFFHFGLWICIKPKLVSIHSNLVTKKNKKFTREKKRFLIGFENRWTQIWSKKKSVRMRIRMREERCAWMLFISKFVSIFVSICQMLDGMDNWFFVVSWNVIECNS